MANRHDEFMKVFDFAVKKFREQSPMKEFQIILALLRHFDHIKKAVPRSCGKRYEELLRQIAKPPRIVLDNLPAQHVTPK